MSRSRLISLQQASLDLVGFTDQDNHFSLKKEKENFVSVRLPTISLCWILPRIASLTNTSNLEFGRLSDSMTSDASKTMETEEDLLSCLQIKIYHPQQHFRGLYQTLAVGTRSRHSAEEPLRLGRDDRACTFALNDARVSRKQLSVQAYRSARSSDMRFAVQNLSRRAALFVNGEKLDYLERADLPDKALVKFGEYQLLVVRERGEAMGSFEVEFEVLPASPLRETCALAGTPVADTGPCDLKSFPPEPTSHGPLETDETLFCYS